MRRAYLLVAIAVAITVAAAWQIRTQRRRPPMRPPWVDGFSASFIEHDLLHPEQSNTGEIHANILATPRGVHWSYTYPDHERITLSTQSPRMIRVLDPMARTWWTPETHAFVRATVSGPDRPPEPFVGGDHAVRRYVGRETLNGRQADHWEITEPLADGQNLVWQYWEDVRLRTALKSFKPGIGSYELTNIHEGRQPDDWFTAPEGYREVSAPKPQSTSGTAR